MLWPVRARLGYWLARRLFHWRWLLQQPRAWAWMQGQYARMAALGHVPAQSFYGHILLFRGQGFGAREEGLRLLRLAAQGGDGKAAYRGRAGAGRRQSSGRGCRRGGALVGDGGRCRPPAGGAAS